MSSPSARHWTQRSAQPVAACTSTSAIWARGVRRPSCLHLLSRSLSGLVLPSISSRRVSRFGASWADSERGAVHVFERDQGDWSHTAEINDPRGSDGDHFGFDVALAGNWLGIGAYKADALEVDSGRVNFYELVNGTWTWMAAFNGDEFGSEAQFGVSVAMGGQRRGCRESLRHHRWRYQRYRNGYDVPPGGRCVGKGRELRKVRMSGWMRSSVGRSL